MPGTCFDEPLKLYRTTLCLSALSKNMEGRLDLRDRDVQRCGEPECKTLKTLHGLELEVGSHKPCDSKLGARLNGRLIVKEFVTAFEDADGEKRGVHAGDFVWEGPGVRVEGRMSGITNAGTHRDPVFDPCQKCHDPGYIEGRLCGSVTASRSPDLEGCYVVGTYRFKYDPSSGGGEGGIVGTFEGSLLCPCHHG